MTGRDRIFAKIRAGLGVTGHDQDRQAAAARRIAASRRHLTPDRVAGKSHEQHMQLLRGFLEGQCATVVEAASAKDVPRLVAKYLRDTNLPMRLKVGADGYLARLPWSTEPALELRHGRAEAGDEVGLSRAMAAVAETGTLVLASGADNPVTINFLPETHIVVIEASGVVGTYEDAWARVRERFGARAMPRTINMISGPSRTGDIGGKLVMGAHGPRRMCVVIVRA